MRRTKEEAQQTREALIEAAVTVFGRKGFTRTTLTDIAKEAGMTRGALYWHFENKVQIFSEMHDFLTIRVEQGVQQILAEAPTAVEALVRFVEFWFATLEDDHRFRAVAEVMYEKIELTDELLEKERKNERAMRELFEEFIQAGQQEGAVRNDVDATSLGTAVYSYVMGLTSVWLSNAGAYSARSDARRFIQLLLEGIAQ